MEQKPPRDIRFGLFFTALCAGLLMLPHMGSYVFFMFPALVFAGAWIIGLLMHVKVSRFQKVYALLLGILTGWAYWMWYL